MTDLYEASYGGEEDTQQGRFLTFSIGQDTYGIEIRYVTEIIGMQAITEIPEVPDHVKGIVNLRGKIIPVIDVRLKFKKQPMEYNDRTCIIVIDINDISAGLIVDNVTEVRTIENQDIALPPSFETGFDNRYVKWIGKTENSIILLLDCDRMFEKDEIMALDPNNIKSEERTS